MTYSDRNIMQRGATLLELAIVTGICGLLLGIILTMVNMTHAAVVKNNVATFQTNSSAVGAFNLKYHNLPGDLSPSIAQSFGFIERSGEAGQGDGNGVVESCTRKLPYLGCENTLFWRDLSQVNLIAASFTTAINIPVDGTQATFQLANYLPRSPFRPDTQIFVYPLEGQNAYYVTRINAVAADGKLTLANAITPQEAHDFDEKMDDSMPMQGRVRSMESIGQYGGAGDINTSAPCVDQATSAYNTDTSILACQISVRAGF